jgi:hypothetical protein
MGSEIRILVFWKEGPGSEKVVIRSSEVWMELGGQYQNLEDIYMIDAAKEENHGLMESLRINTVPYVVFLQKTEGGWVSLNRISGVATKKQIRQGAIKALQHKQVVPQDGPVVETEGGEGIFLGPGGLSGLGLGIWDFMKKFWWLWIALAAYFVYDNR